jgi:hypothetical protein
MKKRKAVVEAHQQASVKPPVLIRGRKLSELVAYDARAWDSLAEEDWLELAKLDPDALNPEDRALLDEWRYECELANVFEAYGPLLRETPELSDSSCFTAGGYSVGGLLDPRVWAYLWMTDPKHVQKVLDAAKAGQSIANEVRKGHPFPEGPIVTQADRIRAALWIHEQFDESYQDFHWRTEVGEDDEGDW